MPIHDWTKADAGLFHDFHNSWLIYLRDALNAGVLPAGYFAMTDQRADVHVPDVLALTRNGGAPAGAGGVAVAEPQSDRRVMLRGRRTVIRRRVLVRNARRVVGVIEIVSPSNKDRDEEVTTFALKAVDLLLGGVNVAVVDLYPPGPHDPGGMHAAICRELRTGKKAAAPPPPDRPLTFAGYAAGSPPEAFLSYSAVGRPIPDIPLYLEGDRYVHLPLEETYVTGFTRLPAPLREVVE